MAVTHGEHLFWMIAYVKDAPLLHRAPVQSTEEPYKASPKALHVRLPRGKALVLGYWHKTGYDMETAMVRAMRGNLDKKYVEGREYGEGDSGEVFPRS